jgi:predicted DNA-binding transcriptional regulator AlpA
MVIHEPQFPELIIARRVRALYGVSGSALNRAVRDGQLPVAGKVGGVGQRVFRRADVERWLLGTGPGASK